MSIYWMIVAAVIILGMIMPQQGEKRKYYIITMAIVHAFVCGFRYQYLTGDLQTYHNTYVTLTNYGWFSDEIIQDGRNTGFQMFMKLIATLTNSNYQLFLLIVAVIIEVAVALLIYKYSSRPWLSYLVWNCLGFYIFGFSAVKQSLSMAFIVFAMICILESRVKLFFVFVAVAGFIHAPAFAFLPAYFLAKRRVNMWMIGVYIAAAGLIFVFRDQIVVFVSEYYYEEETMELLQFGTEGLGGRFFMIVLILICGAFLKGFREKEFESLFHIIVVSAIFQMFSVYNNVFTRFADYYFQFAILFIPQIFYQGINQERINKSYMQAKLPFNNRSIRLLVIILTMLLLWYYYYTCLGQTIEYSVDDYLNFRFMWDVK